MTEYYIKEDDQRLINNGLPTDLGPRAELEMLQKRKEEIKKQAEKERAENIRRRKARQNQNPTD